jgi:hypothetical protein
MVIAGESTRRILESVLQIAFKAFAFRLTHSAMLSARPPLQATPSVRLLKNGPSPMTEETFWRYPRVSSSDC